MHMKLKIKKRGDKGAIAAFLAITTAFVLLVSITAVASALMGGELENRNRAVLDPLTGLLNRSSLEARVAELEQQIPSYTQRHIVKPGVTGWAQINYTYGNTVDDAFIKLQYDLYYIKNRNLALDIAILLRTVKCIIGSVELSLDCEQVFDYGRNEATWEYAGQGYGEAIAHGAEGASRTGR